MTDSAARPAGGLRGHRDFRLLWFGQAVSEAGSVVSLLALPLVAVLTLHGGPFDVGVLSAAAYLPLVLLSLPAGHWADRVSHRRLLVAADAGRAVALAGIPVTAALGRLTFAQLDVTAFVVGSLTVVFDVAYQAYLPALIGRDLLLAGNSRLEFTRATTEIAGPGVAGVLIRAIGAASATAIDAVSFVVSAVTLWAIRANAVARAHRDSGPPRRLLDGVRFVARSPELRAATASTGVLNLAAGGGINAILVLFAVRDLGLSPALIGLWFSLGSLSSPLGAALAARVARRVGIGRTLLLCASAEAAAWMPVAFAPRAFPLPFLVLSGWVGGAAGVAYSVTAISLRQAITPDHLLGRMTAATRLLGGGPVPVGAIAAGALAAGVGLRPAVTILAVVCLLSPLPIALSPLRRLGMAPRFPLDQRPPRARSGGLAAPQDVGEGHR